MTHGSPMACALLRADLLSTYKKCEAEVLSNARIWTGERDHHASGDLGDTRPAPEVLRNRRWGPVSPESLYQSTTPRKGGRAVVSEELRDQDNYLWEGRWVTVTGALRRWGVPRPFVKIIGWLLAERSCQAPRE